MDIKMMYTWKDIERAMKFYLINHEISFLNDVDVYPTGVVVVINDKNKIQEMKEILGEIYGQRYDSSNNRIDLDKFEISLPVEIEINRVEKRSGEMLPLFKNVIYNKSAYDKDVISDKTLEECPVIAFHSYKGGVGRTLSLLTFVKAWSCNKPEDKLLIVDSDIEAPGITWLLEKEGIDGEGFSYLDLLEMVQNGRIEEEKINQEVVNLLRRSTFSVDTGQVIVQHIVLPTYRYEEQILDLYSSPESIARGYNSRYKLAEILSQLGKKLGVSCVLVDLRAGVSEFSAPLIFDPRVKKYIVTSTSFQSVQGTKMLMKQMCKGLPVSEEGIVPEILLTMVPEGLDITKIKSDLIQEYNVTEQSISYTDNVFTELPFASELVHLASLPQIMKSLEGRDFYKQINEFIITRYMDTSMDVQVNNREDIVNKIHQVAEAQITAEGNQEFAVLLTQPISNLIRKYSDSIPQAVILGAKGAGKTFLFKELLHKQTWQRFVESLGNAREDKLTTYVLPLVTPQNLENFTEAIKSSFRRFSLEVTVASKNDAYWYDNVRNILKFCKQKKDLLDWVDFWKQCILHAFKENMELSGIDAELQKKHQQVLFLVDGLEEIFEKTLESESERGAVRALIQNLLNEFKIQYKNIGIIIFLRKDLASNSITVNYEQFENQYRSIALDWSHKEALRLALWLVTKAVPKFCGDIKLEQASQDVVEQQLNKLWGLKLGKNNSNEAYSSRWILAALSDFNSQLQARDIIRFLKNATNTVGREIYKDRVIMPTEIKNAVQECSKAKIKEIKQEIAALRPILEELENASPEKKILPFKVDTFNWNANQEKMLKQEGLLIIDDDKYYLPEIIRHALRFKYEKGARPKVLSLLLKKR